MKKANLKNSVLANLSIRVMMMTIIIGLTVVSCKDGKNNGGSDDNGNGNNNGNNGNTNTVEAAFKQFGADVEKVKPNVSTPGNYSSGNKVDESVYRRIAAYFEKSESDIPAETGLDYNTKMFNYTKSISTDGKCYTNYTDTEDKGNIEEIASYDKGSGMIWNYTWSYKYNGMWVDVYMQYQMSGDKNIGIRLQGAGSY